jgi:hypothetical protein
MGGHLFLGHFGLAFAAKKATPKTSLGTLVLAAQFADLLWPILLLAGLEKVSIVPGLLPASPFDFTSYPISHSLLMQIAWGVLLGIIYFAFKRNSRGALLVGALIPSHWILDVIAHRPDMPLYPGGPKFGLGMWESVPLTLIVEFSIFAAGVAIYATATRAKDGTGKWSLWALVAILGLLYLAAEFGPPPANARVLALSGLALWLMVPWAAWADRHRQSTPE